MNLQSCFRKNLRRIAEEFLKAFLKKSPDIFCLKKVAKKFSMKFQKKVVWHVWPTAFSYILPQTFLKESLKKKKMLTEIRKTLIQNFSKDLQKIWPKKCLKNCEVTAKKKSLPICGEVPKNIVELITEGNHCRNSQKSCTRDC